MGLGGRIVHGVKRRLKGAARKARHLMSNERQRRRQAFQEIYKHNMWGSDPDSKFYSGTGSRGAAVDVYVEQMTAELRRIAQELGRPIKVVDLGCGDFQVGRTLLANLPEVSYLGCDIVPELVAHHNRTYASERIAFQQLDLVTDPLPHGDVGLVRQVLQHLSNAEIAAFLARMPYQYLFVTEGHPAEPDGPANPDISAGAAVRFNWHTGVGGRGVELHQPPYSLPTTEMFRALSPPREIIITERLIRKEDHTRQPVPAA